MIFLIFFNEYFVIFKKGVFRLKTSYKILYLLLIIFNWGDGVRTFTFNIYIIPNQQNVHHFTFKFILNCTPENSCTYFPNRYRLIKYLFSMDRSRRIIMRSVIWFKDAHEWTEHKFYKIFINHGRKNMFVFFRSLFFFLNYKIVTVLKFYILIQ